MPGNRHNEIVEQLVLLGKLMGFKTYSADNLGKPYYIELPRTLDNESLTFVKEIDVIWFNEDNYPKHAFEVELTTGIIQAFTRLYQLRHFICSFNIVIDNESDKFYSYKNKFDKLTTSDPYLKQADRFNLIESTDLKNLLDLTRKNYDLKKKVLGIESELYEEEIQDEIEIPDWVDGGAINYSRNFPESKNYSKNLFEKIIQTFKKDKENIKVKCQKFWVSVYKNETLIFYVYVRRDKLLFDSKFSNLYEDDISLDKIERPESAHIIQDTNSYFIVKDENEINDIIELLNFTYSKL